MSLKPAPCASVVALVTILAAAGSSAASTLPPPQRTEAAADDNMIDDVRTRAIDAYVVRRGLLSRTMTARQARERAADLAPGILAVEPIVGTAVAGGIEVPVILLRFADTPAAPYPSSELQEQLFDAEAPAQTMSAHYREMSRGRLEVTGMVFDWVDLAEDGAFYAGPSSCNGICQQSKLGVMLTEALGLVDSSVDFTRYDNNGPDNLPNSPDDDGFVDFVAFVHPGRGGECSGESNEEIWSHRYSIQDWTGANHESEDLGRHGTPILIDDYVIMPALACDGTTMIEIGVFSHEFGHAFGLPDLYDSQRPQESAGIGGWGLMASGSWGGDGVSRPAQPSHMTAWSKEFLGWLSPRVVEDDQAGVLIAPVRTGDSVRVDYSDEADPTDTRYLLLEYRTREGFDRTLVNHGLLVTEVNNVRVQGGLASNSVNGLPEDMGVNVIEADGERHLDRDDNRADPNDVFPGGKQVTSADISHPERIRAALCNIVVTPEHVSLDIFTSRTTCPGALAQAAVSPADALEATVLGEEVVVKGFLINEGTNYFTDRRLVVRGDTGDGAEISVVARLPLETADSEEGTGPPVQDLSDVLGKQVLLRGRIERTLQKGVGLTDTLVVEELEVVEP